MNQCANLRSPSPTVGRKTQICTLIHTNLESQIPSLTINLHIRREKYPVSVSIVGAPELPGLGVARDVDVPDRHEDHVRADGAQAAHQLGAREAIQ